MTIDVTYMETSGPVTAEEVGKRMLDEIDSASFPGLVEALDIRVTALREPDWSKYERMGN